jgi:hypothetical protein
MMTPVCASGYSLLGQNALSELGTITLGNGRLRID